MASSRGVDPEILGKLAERLSEAGKALKSVTALSAQTQNHVTELQTQVQNTIDRLKTVESIIHGNGTEGLKTRLAVAERDIDSIKDSSGKKSNAWPMLLIGVIGTFIALGSMFASCGPQIIKAWSPSTSTAGK